MTGGIVQQVIPFILAVSFLLFCWGLLMYLMAPSDREVRGNAEEIMFKGVVGVLGATIVWAIIRIVQNLL